MCVVLGIDAAWVEKNPSGVSLVKKNASDEWKCLAVAPSYASFINLADDKPISWDNRLNRQSSPSHLPRLLAAAEKIAVSPIDIIAIDMPISRISITGRRTSDQSISQKYGSFQAAVHSPSPTRPGSYGVDVTREISKRGFNVCTQTEAEKPLIEVYPHAAIIELLKISKRPEYKVIKSKKYWPNDNVGQRIENLRLNMEMLYEELSKVIRPDGHGQIPFPKNQVTLASLKSYEDALDALVCSYVGIRYHEVKATPFGDNNSAIWVPDH